jgi:TAG lipase/lysophosphatidylethanolamine acyltransferase
LSDAALNDSWMATRSSSVTGFLKALIRVFFDVAFFWQTVCGPYVIVVMFRTDLPKRLWAWWTRPSQKDIQLECFNTARYYEEWEAAAFALDELYGNDLWFDLAACSCWERQLIVDNPGDRIHLPNIMTIDSFIQGFSIS